MKNYGIREDYLARTEAVTVSQDSAGYWNEKRIAASGYYQYYVYKNAASFLESSGRKSFADIGCGYPTKVRELILPATEDITLVDHPSIKAVIERDFPEMNFVPVDLEQAADVFQRKFDCVVSADVIEHLLNPDLLLDFVRGILKPDGRVFLSTPERDTLRGPGCLSSAKAEHVREWNSEEFQKYLTHSGLELVEHYLLPQGRLLRAEALALPIFRHAFRKRYLACQLAVCRLRG